MRSPTKSVSMTKRVRDAEADLNLPPGFRFHPTDEELVVHYLCPKAANGHCPLQAAGVAPPPSIIAEVDLYKHDPWDLPEMALFGTKEWYFFTPRDRKYPNGSRPNRAAGNGYWKATGADKPIRPKSTPNTTVGIKKALVFYAGKGPQGIKTNWIMHEYRLAKPDRITGDATTHKLDDWVLCRLYNKKNDPDEKIVQESHQNQNQNQNHQSPLDSLNSFEDSDVEFGGGSTPNQAHQEDVDEGVGDIMFSVDHFPPQCLSKVNGNMSNNSGMIMKENVLMEGDDHDDNYGNEWLTNLSLEELQRFLEATPN